MNGILLFLGACGAGGGGGGIDPALARIDLYEAQKLRVLGDPEDGVLGLPITAQGEMPTTGGVSYAGFATLRVETGPQPLILFGDADLQVDFDTRGAQGAVVDLFGTTAAAAVTDYNGIISLQGSQVGQNMALSYAGDLNGGGQALGLDGVLTGVFLGEAATAFAGGDLEAQIDTNGTLRDGTFVIVLEAVAP